MRSFILIAFISLFIGCTKTKTTLGKNDENKQKDLITKTTMERQLAEKNTNATDLKSFFLTYDTSILRILRNGIDPTPEKLASSNGPGVQYMIDKNSELIGILSNLRPTVYNGMNPDDDMVVYAGVIEMVIQLESTQGNINVMKPFPWSCIRGGSRRSAYRSRYC